MRIKGEYVLREISGDFILIPVGTTALNMNGIITLDELGVAIWKGIDQGLTEEDILQNILSEYEVDEITARKDLEEFIEKLQESGLVE